MKKLLAAVFLMSAFAVAQPVTYPGILTSSGPPTGSCNSNTVDIDTTTGDLYTCPDTGVWNLAGGGSGGTAIPSGNNQLFSGGGVVWTGGLNFTVSAASYQIATANYNSPQTNITLATADPSNPRIDSIVVNTSGAVAVITGTPAATPAAPSVDPTSQLQLTVILIPAGSSTPAVTNEDIYIDNSEWTCVASTNFNCASTTTPYQGTFSIAATAAVVGNNVTLTKPAAGTITLASYSAVSFYILNNRATWPTNKVILISFYNGSTLVGTGVSIKNGVYGFNTANTSSYQQIVIPTAAFLNGSSTSTVNKVVFQVAGGTSTLGFHLDTIRIQAGGSGGASGGGGTVTSVVGTSPIVVTNGTTTPVVSCPTCGTGTGSVTSVTFSSPLTGGTITTSGTVGIGNATNSALGAAQCDGTTITCSSGIISAVSTGGFAWGGDGSDGAVTFDGNATVLGFAPATVGSTKVYTMTRDIYTTSLTINATDGAGKTVVLLSGNYGIFVQGTATINGTVRNQGLVGGLGGNGSTFSGGAGGTNSANAEGLGSGRFLIGPSPSGTVSPGGGGTTGNGSQANAATAGNSNGTSVCPAATGGSNGSTGASGGIGGNGGTGTGGAVRTGGAGGTLTACAGSARDATQLIGGWVAAPASGVSFSQRGLWTYSVQNGGGAGGSGGGGDGTTTAGGGGGGGGIGGAGGTILISAQTITVGATGVISADGGKGGNGGNGVSPAAGNTGGGGGGAGGSGGQGGNVILIYHSYTNSGSVTANGGAGGTGGTHGTGHGTGQNGGDGGTGTAGLNGLVIQLPN